MTSHHNISPNELLKSLSKKKGKNKYNAVKTWVGGIEFASVREAKRYAELQLLVRAKKILNLILQPRYPFRLNDRLMFTYVADFSYVDIGTERHKLVIEDAKGFRTKEYKLKKKLIEEQHGIRITEV
jgi:hypothetical protein